MNDEDGWLETLEILADPDLMEAIREGLEDVAANRLMTQEEVWSELEEPTGGSPSGPRRL